jgi:signal transduction histidine kinase
MTVALSGLSCLLIWATVKPMYRARSWAWDNVTRLTEVTDQLRDRQAELLRLSKSLNSAYDRLEQVSRELDEQRQIAESARRAKAQFAAMVSHELRTPLNLIIGFSEMMVLSPHSYVGETLPETYRGDVEAIYRSARHLSNLVDDVLELSQIEANRMGLTKDWARLGDIVAQAFAMVAAIYRDKGLSLDADVADTPPIYVDATRVREILVNLLVNAVRFTDRGGVTVRATRAETEVEVTVSDTGVGIQPENLPLVFEEYRHVGRSASAEHDRGFGLGLVICKRFVELHGGRIRVDSSVEVGTTFAFTLPSSDAVVADSGGGWFGLRRVSLPGEHSPAIVVVGGPESLFKVVQRHLDG